MVLNWRKRLPHRIARGLRFRLTFIYVLFSIAALLIVGLIFRETLEAVLDQQSRDILEEEWAIVKGYYRWEPPKLVWFADKTDPDENAIVARLKRFFLSAEVDGIHIIEVSPAYRQLGIESPEEIRAAVKEDRISVSYRRDSNGTPFMVRSGPMVDSERRFYISIARSLENDQRVLEKATTRFYTTLPFLVLATALLSWLIAGRALAPMNDVARAAQRISSANLNVEIPTRGAGDELDHLIESFNRMIERLAAAFQQTRQFSTDVSHELRTPLTAVRGQLEVALFTGQNVEQYRDAIVNSLQDIERLSQIVKTLLLLSQAESGQLTLQKTSIDFAPVVLDIVDQYQIPAESVHVTLEAHVPPSCPMEADRIQLERLLYNLISNALKFTPPEGRVDVRLAVNGGSVELRVEDTGRGIPPTHVGQIFDRFYRVPAAGKAPDPASGLGLGLSFVAWIVKAHNGEIRVESEVGKGTRFIVTLPQGTPAPAPEYNEISV